MKNKKLKKDNEKLVGVKNKELLNEIITKASNAMPCSMPSEKQMHAVGHSMVEMQPNDPIEAKLCAKEAALYSLSMKYLQRAEASVFSEDSDMVSRMWYETIMNSALKLSRLHNETVETLNRYKRRGEQKVVVQHQYGVQVNEGGQAIVSTQVVFEGEGVKEKMEEEPHGQSKSMWSEIENQPSPTLPIKGDEKWEMSISRRTKHRAK